MSSAINIRSATPEDAAAILSIFNPIIEEGLFTVFADTFTEEQEAEYIKNLHPRGIFHVAERDGKVIAFQTLEPFAAFSRALDHTAIMGTYVGEGCRGEGVSKVLFEETFKRAVELGYEKVFTYVRGDNPRALAAYMKQGFKVIGTAHRQAKVKGKYIDEVLIEKFL